MSDDEGEKELVKIDYEAIDEATGFKKVDWDIWRALEEWKEKPEDDREPAGDPTELDSRLEWAKWYATEGPLKPNTEEPKILSTFENRCIAVVRLGLYAGVRDDFSQRNGKSKAIYSNGDSYEGQFYEGKKNGQGKYVSKSLGKSEVDKLIEHQIMNLPEEERLKSELTGCWSCTGEQKDKVVKNITQSLAIGEEIVRTALELGYFSFYLGDYENGTRSGIGVMKSRDGSVYKGEWLNGKRHGEGILYYVNGDTYSGNWNEGHKDGYGTYTFAYWLKTIIDNNPCYTLTEGGDYRGEWGTEPFSEEVDGEKVNKTARGIIKEGEWRMPDGFHFEGTFNRHNQPHTLSAPLPSLHAEGAAEPQPKTCMHFPRWGLSQFGIMKKVCKVNMCTV